MSLNNPKGGLGYAAEFQSSALPWVTSSQVPVVTSGILRCDFPKVSRFVTVLNNASASAGQEVRIGFTRNGMTAGYYSVLAGGQQTTMEVRVTSLYIAGDTSNNLRVSVLAGLTNIDKSMMPQLSGTLDSGDAGWSGVGLQEDIQMELVKIPDDRLRFLSGPVDKFDRSLQELSTSMKLVMAVNGGVGLAAPQVGVNKRVIVVNVAPGSSTPDLITMVNPVIVYSSSSQEAGEEGCLSVPGERCTVTRAKSVEVEYREPNGFFKKKIFTGYVARIVQHEIDHLDGVLMIDRSATPLEAHMRAQEYISAH